MIENFVNWVSWPFVGVLAFALVPLPYQIEMVRRAWQPGNAVPVLEQARWPLIQVLVGLLMGFLFLLSWEEYFIPTIQYMRPVSLGLMALAVFITGVMSVLTWIGAKGEPERWPSDEGA